MSEGTSGLTPQGTPPSFIPSGSRKRRPSGQVPRAAANMEGAGDAPRAGASHDGHAHGVRGAASSHGSSRGSSSHGLPSFTPASARRGAAQGRADRQSSSYEPQQPTRTPRRAAGSGRVAAASDQEGVRSAYLDEQSRRSAASFRRVGRPGAGPGASSGSFARGGVRAGTARRTLRRMSPLRIAAAVVIALLVALLLGGFGMWNWVNGQLNKQDWLTGKADTSGTSWLILGSDERSGEEAKTITGFRTDTILVLTKPNSGTRSLISIPRDSLVKVNGQYMKINAVAQLAGRKALVSQVEAITGQSIDHVAQIKFDGLQHVVDALGGVELCYDRTVNDARSTLNWTAGCHNADGATALAFSRMRYSDPQGDFGRAARQRQVIAAIAKKAMSRQTLTNFGTVKKTLEASLASITVDSQTNPYTLAQMVFAFRDATSGNGVTGSVYWTNPDYYVTGVGSSVLLDDAKNLSLFSELAAGSHKAGTVGTLAQ
ncbi:LCP family protein [Bifidobacterium leontopitheci]|uniref:Transcriptional regulator n=1 Tax=Bifidobacterium leontopitheci TaxID=2650774 RepID=A0A6I1GPT0_9BIFI|nr:LCP family protein [Bifidobacterium leontopitheci]KAB7790088.1 transcriptional regulator [Bifidobacterium leontopitheci]